MIGLLIVGVWLAIVLAHAWWYDRRLAQSVTISSPDIAKGDLFMDTYGRIFVVSRASKERYQSVSHVALHEVRS